MLGDAKAADGGESSSPVYLLEGFFTPMMLIKEVIAEPGASRCVKESLADGDLCVVV
jgi:hypothetical protein